MSLVYWHFDFEAEAKSLTEVTRDLTSLATAVSCCGVGDEGICLMSVPSLETALSMAVV